MLNYDLSPFYRSTVGFDRLLSMLDKAVGAEQNAPTYPPYNIERTGENAYRITLAVAGFGEQELSVETRENTLTVRGSKEPSGKDEKRDVLYQGIAARAFERRFQLADHVHGHRRDEREWPAPYRSRSRGSGGAEAESDRHQRRQEDDRSDQAGRVRSERLREVQGARKGALIVVQLRGLTGTSFTLDLSPAFSTAAGAAFGGATACRGEAFLACVSIGVDDPLVTPVVGVAFLGGSWEEAGETPVADVSGLAEALAGWEVSGGGADPFGGADAAPVEAGFALAPAAGGVSAGALAVAGLLSGVRVPDAGRCLILRRGVSGGYTGPMSEGMRASGGPP